MSGGEQCKKRRGGDTRVRVCRMIERNHDQLRNQLVVASGSFGLLPRRSALPHSCRACRPHQRPMGTPDKSTIAYMQRRYLSAQADLMLAIRLMCFVSRVAITARGYPTLHAHMVS